MKFSIPFSCKKNIKKLRNGFPETGAIHFGVSATTDRNLVPRPPARMIASLIIGVGKINFFYELANNMAKCNMALLYSRGIVRGDVN